MKTEHLLAAYGTLRPGEVNHRLLENVPGEWLDGWVTGDRGEEDDYPAFCIKAASAVVADQAAGVDALGIVLGGSGNGEQNLSRL